MMLRTVGKGLSYIFFSAAAYSNADAAEPTSMELAERAVGTFRTKTFLPTECETAFRHFWKAFNGTENQGLIKEPSPFSDEEYFGFGALESAEILENVQMVCAAQTGARGDLVVRILRDRALKKEERAREVLKANREILGY